jgi:hypothetical protein
MYLEERTFLYELEGSGVNLEFTEVHTLLHLLYNRSPQFTAAPFQFRRSLLIDGGGGGTSNNIMFMFGEYNFYALLFRRDIFALVVPIKVPFDRFYP